MRPRTLKRPHQSVKARVIEKLLNGLWPRICFRWLSSVLIWQVAPQVVEVAVPGCTRGIVALTAEEPELAITVNPVCRVAAATGSPDLIRLVWSSLITV